MLRKLMLLGLLLLIPVLGFAQQKFITTTQTMYFVRTLKYPQVIDQSLFRCKTLQVLLPRAETWYNYSSRIIAVRAGKKTYNFLEVRNFGIFDPQNNILYPFQVWELKIKPGIAESIIKGGEDFWRKARIIKIESWR